MNAILVDISLRPEQAVVVRFGDPDLAVFVDLDDVRAVLVED